jgi:hypothetical protein
METSNNTPNLPQQQPPAQQPPAQQPPSQNPNDLSPQQVRDIAAGIPQQAQPAPQQAPPAQIPGLPPIERAQDGTMSMRLPTGQVYKGANEYELMAQLAQAQINASGRISELGNETARLRNGLAAVTGQPVQGDGIQPAQSQFDRAVYMELQAQDPILAMNYLDQHRFGLNNINEVIPYYQRTAQAADEFRTAQTVSQFRILAPEFPGTQQAVDSVMGFMKQNNIPFTAPNLKLVHDGMVKAGVYQPLQMTQQPPLQAAQPAPQPGAPQPPQIDPRLLDPNPQGPYAFGPGGFGTNYPAQPSASVAPQPTQPTVVAPPPLPTAQYPPIPQQAAPLPMPTVTPTAAPNGQPSEAQVNEMDTSTLRRYIESNLPR